MKLHFQEFQFCFHLCVFDLLCQCLLIDIRLEQITPSEY